MIEQIRNTVKVSKNRARVIARQETARLQTAAKSIYFNNTKVKKEYDKVWVSRSDARPSHLYMNNQKADKDGWFTTQDGVKTQGPPLGFNCRCRVILKKK
jgi:SPP1 gp7 family putative phage head morphogenesis protein